MASSENRARRNVTRCPGCGAIIVGGSQYCSRCGGKLDGLTVDYSQMRRKASDVYDDDSSDTTDSSSFDEVDERFADTMWVRFACALVGTPILGFILLIGGLVEDRTDMLVIGVIFILLTIPLIVIAIKYLGKSGGQREKDRWNPPPRYIRRF